MNELSLHILDLVQNSITAGANLITIEITESLDDDLLTIIITDNGCGMDDEFLSRVTTPFTTTRTTRKVGLGIPMFMQAAQMCGGEFKISSELTVGTCIGATFKLSHIDLAPLGDIIGTMLVLINGAADDLNFKLTMKRNDKRNKNEFIFDTQEIRTAVDDLPLNLPEILEWITEYLKEGIASLNVN